MALPLAANMVPSSVSSPAPNPLMQSALASVLWIIGDVELMGRFLTRSWWSEGHAAAASVVADMAAHVVQRMETSTLLHQLRCHIAFRVRVLATLVRHHASSTWLPDVLDRYWSFMQTALRTAVFLTTAMSTLEAALVIDAWCMDRAVKPGVHAVLEVLLPSPLVDSILSYVYAPPLVTALSHHSQLQASLPLFLWQRQTPKLSSWHVYVHTAVCYVATNGCTHDVAIAALLLLTAGTSDFMATQAFH
ncbi:hypothetical protein SDRG_02238 [Saprolegnia diclina VS20]|uniref:Uncharacterized protein n=1 Tax=Saprolegnia diclina (strain VS20) TaxID=1156394 RepID=T0SC20_SAPDV|nr:hypothetical protein SDRG_02238 [Saprolegnia diclina VS20]EQC40337.1 hypothetical protein SDRG_02238 [Saprolegnia diclina VS20]|eukprot:XP_008606036.1 hypothetical protein SDRG_02238 [Saprolegnia diclina VS20]